MSDKEVKRVCITKVVDQPTVEKTHYEDSEEDDVVTSSESESGSGSDSESDDSGDDVSITSSFVLKNDILHFVLSKFFVTETEEKKNIATILEEINQSLKKLAKHTSRH